MSAALAKLADKNSEIATFAMLPVRLSVSFGDASLVQLFWLIAFCLFFKLLFIFLSRELLNMWSILQLSLVIFHINNMTVFFLFYGYKLFL